jgi:lipoprotein-anchoring transpeptidase ErfK/SrfK
VVVNKQQHQLALYRRQGLYPAAVGRVPGDKQRVGDCRTPLSPEGGYFHVTRKVRTPADSQFGPAYLGLSCSPLPWSGIAIHGTNEPWTIGTDASHGCVRLRTEDVLSLYGQLDLGTPVIIRP